MQLQLATTKVYIGHGYTWVCIMSVLEVTFEDVISTTVCVCVYEHGCVMCLCVCVGVVSLVVAKFIITSNLQLQEWDRSS